MADAKGSPVRHGHTSKVGAVFQAVLLLTFKAEGAVELSGGSVSPVGFWRPVSAVGSWGRRRLVGSGTMAVVGAVALAMLLWWLELLCGQDVRILIRGGPLAKPPAKLVHGWPTPSGPFLVPSLAIGLG